MKNKQAIAPLLTFVAFIASILVIVTNTKTTIPVLILWIIFLIYTKAHCAKKVFRKIKKIRYRKQKH